MPVLVEGSGPQVSIGRSYRDAPGWTGDVLPVICPWANS